MLNSIFNLSEIYDILIIIAVIICLFIVLKFKSFRVFALSVIAVIYVGLSVVAMFAINNYYTASGGIFGELEQILNPDVVVNDMSFDLQNLTLLETDEENKYEMKISTEYVLEPNEEYDVLVNGIPSNIINYSSDFVVAEYDYVFYNEDLIEVLFDTLTIKFSFFKNSTIIQIYTLGGEKAVGYWNYFFNMNNFIIEIK